MAEREPFFADKGQAARALGIVIAFTIVFVSKPILRDIFTEHPFLMHLTIFASTSAAIGLLLWMLGKKFAGRKEHG